MWWIVGGGWLLAVLVAAVVLGFCGYELAWKSRRLNRDMTSLQDRIAALQAVQAGLVDAQRRLPRRG